MFQNDATGLRGLGIGGQISAQFPFVGSGWTQQIPQIPTTLGGHIGGQPFHYGLPYDVNFVGTNPFGVLSSYGNWINRQVPQTLFNNVTPQHFGFPTFGVPNAGFGIFNQVPYSYPLFANQFASQLANQFANPYANQFCQPCVVR